MYLLNISHSSSIFLLFLFILIFYPLNTIQKRFLEETITTPTKLLSNEQEEAKTVVVLGGDSSEEEGENQQPKWQFEEENEQIKEYNNPIKVNTPCINCPPSNNHPTINYSIQRIDGNNNCFHKMP